MPRCRMYMCLICTRTCPEGNRYVPSGHDHSRVGHGQIETGRVKSPAHLGLRPVLQLVVLLVRRVGEDLLEPLVAPGTTAVLRRAGALTFDAGRIDPAGLGLG